MITEDLRKRSNRRAWLNVVACFLCMFTIYAITLNCAGLFLKPMAETFQASRAAVGSISAIAMIGAVPAVVIFGIIFDKKSVKIPMAIGCFLTAIAFIIFGFAPSIEVCYIGAVISGFGASGTMQLPISLVLNNWFVEKRGLALGIAFSGSGFGGVVFTQLINYFIQEYSWRTAYVSLGIITMILTIIPVLLFINKSPQTVGLIPYGLKKLSDTSAKSEETKVVDKEKKKDGSVFSAMKSKEFILFFLGWGLIAFVMAAVKGHLPAYMTDLGYTDQIAANILSLTVFTVIPGKPLFGVIYDKLGNNVGTIGSIGMMIIAVGLFIFTPYGFIFAILFGIIYGVGSAYATVGPSILVAEIFKSNKNFGTIYSVLSTGATLLGAFGPILFGAIYDNTGSYNSAWIMSIVCFIVGMVLVLLAIRTAVIKQSNKA